MCCLCLHYEQPPLPEEDYPTDDLEEPQSPPVFGRDMSIPAIKRTVIPRPSLEPSVPAGWTRNQQPDGKTVFTSDRTQEKVGILCRNSARGFSGNCIICH